MNTRMETCSRLMEREGEREVKTGLKKTYPEVIDRVRGRIVERSRTLIAGSISVSSWSSALLCPS